MGFYRELNHKSAVRRGVVRPGGAVGLQLESETFPKQREFILDEMPRITLCTPRRAAKTESLIRKMFRLCVRHSRAIIPYVSSDREVSKRNIWDRLQEMSERYKLRFDFNHTDLIARYAPTNSQIELHGLATKKEVGKLRGRKYKLAVIDETQEIFIDLEGFILSVITPALGDERGQLIMAGTPDPFRRQQVWYQACQSPHPRWFRWKRHSWLLTDNIFFRDPQGYLKEIREEEGYSEEDPRYQAEYLGLWTASRSNLCVDSYDSIRNDYLDPWHDPMPGYVYVLAIDPAYHDATAFVVEAYSTTKRHTLVVESFAKTNMIVSDIAAMTQSLMERYPIGIIPIDEAKMGKHVARELAERYGLPVVAAEKKDKRMRLAFTNSDLRTGRLQVLRNKNQTLIDQWQSVLWDREHQREAEGQVCDLFDAQGYAHMVCRSYFEAEPEVNLDPGEKHWQNELAEARSRKYGQDPYDYTHNPMETP